MNRQGEYGLLAESVWHPEDFSSVVYRLRPEAKFHDSEPVKPEDVIFSLESVKANLPNRQAYYKDIVKVEKTGEREVTFTFGIKGNRELPQITGQLAILPKHWWTGKDANGKQRGYRSLLTGGTIGLRSLSRGPCCCRPQLDA